MTIKKESKDIKWEIFGYLFLHINWDRKMVIRIFNKITIKYYKFYLYMQDINNYKNTVCDLTNISIKKINIDNINQCENPIFSVSSMKKKMMLYGEMCQGYIAYINEKPAAFFLVLFQGASSKEYKIKSNCIFTCNEYVFPRYRGHRLMAYLKNNVFNELHGISKAYSVVRCNNNSQIRNMEKSGSKIISKNRIVTVCKYSFPFRSI